MLLLQLAWNDLKNKLGTYGTALKNNPAQCIETAMHTIESDRCRNWIRHCEVYKEGAHY